MTRVTVVPAGPLDAEMHKGQYEQLRSALSSEGYDANVDVGIERRGGSGVGQAVAEIAVHVGGDLVGDALSGIVALVIQHLRGLRRHPSKEPRYAVLYGPRGEVLKKVELAEDE
jgi:hypothetical protein